MTILSKNIEFTFKNYVFVDKIKVTSCIIYSFIGRSYTESTELYRSGIPDKTEDRIERSHQVGKKFERRSQCATDFT